MTYLFCGPTEDIIGVLLNHFLLVFRLIHPQRALDNVIYGNVISPTQETLFFHWSSILLKIVKRIFSLNLVTPDFGSVEGLI